MSEPSSRRLTVVQVLPALESGGVERGTLEVGKYLVEHGHRSIVISAGGRMVAPLVREGSEHVTWDIGHKSLWTLRLVPKLRRFLADNRVDILHARSRMPAWVAWLAWRGMDPATRPRFVTTVHGLYSVNRYSAVMVNGERIIAVSETVREYILRHYPQVDASRIVVIPRGVDAAEYPHGYQPPETWLAEWHTQFPQLVGKRVLTLPGRITRLKGHEDFIELVARLKAAGLPVHGLIVGGVHPRKRRYYNALLDKVRRMDLSADISFTGQRADLKEIMTVSDLVLSLSTQPESFGRTVLEALSLGVPVVGYDHGGVGEVLRRFYPEGMVAVGDLDGIVRKCITNALKRIELPSGFPSLENMLTATLAAYEGLAASATPYTTA